jgi:plasmid segregation protein ParM
MQAINKPRQPNGQSFVARAVDIGFGYTKFSKGNIQEGWALDCQAIPSVAPAVLASQDTLSSGGVLAAQATVNVTVGGQRYAVGPDALRAASGLFVRHLDESFFSSPQYLALLRGALYYMDLPQDQADIDCLVVGLPLEVYLNKELRSGVAARISGEHRLPSRGDPHSERTVTVRNVHVLPQAMGALISQCQSQRGLGRLADETHLVVDVGYGTLLWVVSEGQTPVASRSGQTMGGVATLLQTIAAQIGIGLKDNPTMLNRLDRAIRDESYELKIDGQVVDIAPYRKQMQVTIGQHLAVLTRSLGHLRDIDNIYLTGGGGLHYLPTLQEAFKNFRIYCEPDRARFDNVRGYQIVAEMRAAQLLQPAREMVA